MFVLITTATLLVLAAFQPPQIVNALPAHSLASFAVFWPGSWQMLVFYIVWGVALLYSILAPNLRPNVLQYISKLGANANMQVLQVLLLIAALLLCSWGWFTGDAVVFVPGTILMLGLLGNSMEQRSLLF